MVVSALNAVSYGTCLLVARGEDDDLLGRKHGGNAYGQRRLRDQTCVAAEEAGVDLDGVGGQRLDARARLERREGLVEGQVAIFAHTAHEEVDAARLLDARLIVGALLDQVFGIAVENVDILGHDVDVAEEVVPHERVVALGMLLRQTHIFVHVEGDDVLERHLARLVEADKLLVGLQRRRAGREAQYEGRRGEFAFESNLLDDVTGSPLRYLLRGVFDNYSHGVSFFGGDSFRGPASPPVGPERGAFGRREEAFRFRGRGFRARLLFVFQLFR